MEYTGDFNQDFMKRTISLIENYSGESDATLLLNCLLGLLIVPKETAFSRIPTDPISNLTNWGISPSSINTFAEKTNSNKQPETLRGFVHSLRNSVAHFRIKPIHKNNLVYAFQFTDISGFEAIIAIDEMRNFVFSLAQYLDQNPALR